MDVIKRDFFSDDLITLILIFALILIFFIKLFKPQQLLGYSIAFFTQGFIEKRAEENTTILSPFHGLLFTFTMLIVSLTFYVLIGHHFEGSNTFVFGLFFLATSSYFIIKFIMSYLLVNLFNLREDIGYFFYAKNGYLYSICLWLYPVLILNQYWLKNPVFLLIVISLLLIFRLFLILSNNKFIIFTQFFYFILYFCTLELAPLLILYKTTTN